MTVFSFALLSGLRPCSSRICRLETLINGNAWVCESGSGCRRLNSCCIRASGVWSRVSIQYLEINAFTMIWVRDRNRTCTRQVPNAAVTASVGK
ncbi:hypothetical protein BJ165DRAFT_10620 [Panaeolus papilionaceus]|nr:hypothetical protein BJ165DRAFT_10620 [Panaeolus papilionaceus]